MTGSTCRAVEKRQELTAHPKAACKKAAAGSGGDNGGQQVAS